jgi:hypothetical protein
VTTRATLSRWWALLFVCTVGYDNRCGAQGAIIGNRGCFLAMPTTADLTELHRLEQQSRRTAPAYLHATA